MELKHIVIGDVHGDYKTLERILGKVGIERKKGKGVSNQWISKRGYKAVLLGDLNDSRLEGSVYSSWKTLCIGRDLCRSGVGIVLHSNHQEKLLLYLKGGIRGSVPSQAMYKTLEEIRGMGPSNIKPMVEWLSNNPLTYSFQVGTQIYSCAHAYYPSESLDKNSKEYKDLCIEGPLNEQGSRLPWWCYPEYIDRSRVVLCGHYHRVFSNKFVKVLDGKCGTCLKGMLVGFIPEEGRFVRVRSSGWQRQKVIVPHKHLEQTLLAQYN